MYLQVAKSTNVDLSEADDQETLINLDDDNIYSVVRTLKLQISNLRFWWQSEVGGQFAHHSLMFITFYL